jgi:hypothetical protein
MIMDTLIELGVNLVAAAQKSRGPLGQLNLAALQLLERRYRMFLRLCQKYPAMHLSPTGDIDEVWHLHMLHPQAYYDDCMRIFGGILDHNPGFGLASEEEWGQLKAQFGAVEELWAKEYGESYVLAQKQGLNAEMTVCEAKQGINYGMTVCCANKGVHKGMTVCEAKQGINAGMAVCEAKQGINAGMAVCEAKQDINAGMTVCEAKQGINAGMTVCEAKQDIKPGMSVCEARQSAALAELGIVPGLVVCEAKSLLTEFAPEAAETR